MARIIWKGAITFGLVHIPVALYPASHEDAIDFDWLDKRTLDPVGYKRINKRTGREITMDHIVRGVAHGEGKYIVVDDEELRNAYPRRTQTIEIEAFVDAGAIPFVHLERPYYLAPINKGEKVYALLREALLAEKRIGVARFVIHAKEHLAALVPVGPALMLNTLRWGSEIRPWNELELPSAGSAGLKSGELTMARQLIGDMTAKWDPEQYANHFNEAIHKLVEKKAEAGEAKAVEPLERPLEDESGGNVIDLTELLKRSLKGPKAPAHKATAKKTAAKPKAPARKAAARKRA